MFDDALPYHLGARMAVGKSGKERERCSVLRIWRLTWPSQLLHWSSSSVGYPMAMETAHHVVWEPFFTVYFDLGCCFSPVNSQEDVLNNSLAFSPLLTHQVFGEKETIFGYRGLKIKVGVRQIVSLRPDPLPYQD